MGFVVGEVIAMGVLFKITEGMSHNAAFLLVAVVHTPDVYTFSTVHLVVFVFFCICIYVLYLYFIGICICNFVFVL